MSSIPAENLSYDFNNNSCDEDKMCGHYTQMVWADTHRVGCAVHVCTDMEGLNWGRTNFLVCNYYPAGNYEGERPYVEGDWCSRCPENLQKCENNLCVDDTLDEMHDDVDDGEDEDVTEIPATTEPVILLDEEPEEEIKEEEEAHVPPPATTDMYVQPDTTAPPAAPPTTTSTPSITTTSAEDMEEVQAEITPEENTPDPGTQAPDAPPTTPERQEEGVKVNVEEVEVEEEEEEEEKIKEKEEKIKPAEKAERDVVGKIFQEVTMSAASVCSPSVLLACVTGVLTLRL
uniref:Peptidase inhibitor 16-like n=1 Tax=Labrus bergylta TaxID=56723 RepID=A0A3Q3E2B1_9LABR